MPTPLFDIEARFFSRATGLRLAVSPDDLLPGLTWELTEAGGTAQITVPLAVLFDAAFPVQGGDTVEVWALGTGETVPRCRGRVGQPEASLDLKEVRTITAYGLMEDMNRVILDEIVLAPGGADLSYYASLIADDYAARRPGLDFVRDIETVGVSLERLELTNSTARAGMDAIAAQSGGNVVWGWDIDPALGQDRFYLRPRISQVGSQFFVGGNVQYVHSPSELQGLCNGMKIQGGPAKYPNLITNGGFEVPVLPAELDGNLILNSGFEDAAGSEADDPDSHRFIWTLLGGATANTIEDTVGRHPPHSGRWMLVLDHPGEEAWQEVAVTPGVGYTAGTFAAQQDGSAPAAGSLIVEGRQGRGGAVLETYTLALVPPSTAWTGGQASTVLSGDALQLPVTFQDAAVSFARVRLVCTAGSSPAGLMIDDVTFAQTDAVGQTAWQQQLQHLGGDGNKFLSVDWASRAAAWEGAYGVRVQAVTNGSTRLSLTAENAFPEIAPTPGQTVGRSGYHFAPQPDQALQGVARVRMSPGLATADGQAYITYDEWAGDGHGTQYQITPVNIPNDGAWHLLKVAATAHSDAATAMTTVGFSKPGYYDVDGVECRDQAAYAGVTDAQLLDPLQAGYLRGTDFERYVTAEALCPAGSAAAGSFSVYGRQEQVVGNPAIVDWDADAQQWAVAYFTRNAVAIDRPQVRLLHEPAQRPDPGAGTRVQVSGLASPDLIDWIAKATYSWAKADLTVTLEIDDERPTWAKLLSNLSAGGSGGSASAIAAVSGRPGGGGNTATPAGITLTDGTTTVGGVSSVTFTGAAVSQAGSGAAGVTITGSSDHQVAVDSSDTSPGYLGAKITGGANVTVTDAGGQLTIAAASPAPPPATNTALGLVRGGGAGNCSINADGSIEAPTAAAPAQATNAALGVVRGGGTGNCSVNADGSIQAPSGSGGGSSTLAGLSDVAISGPADGQVLTYSAAQSKWENVTPPSGGIDGNYDATPETGGRCLLVVNTQSGTAAASPPPADGVFRQYVFINASSGTVTLTPRGGTAPEAAQAGGATPETSGGTQTTGDTFVNVAYYAVGGTLNPASVALGPGKTATMWSDPGLSTWYYTLA